MAAIGVPKRGHAGGGAGHQQRLALVVADRKHLRDQRADRAARHDDRPLRAERTAGADRDRRRERLQNRDLDVQAGAADQDRFDRFRNAVAADLLGAVTRHQADDQRADHRHADGPKAERRILQAHFSEAEAAEIGDVGGEFDQREQGDAGEYARGCHDHGDSRNHQNPRIGREVAETMIDFDGGVRFGRKDAHEYAYSELGLDLWSLRIVLRYNFARLCWTLNSNGGNEKMREEHLVPAGKRISDPGRL